MKAIRKKPGCAPELIDIDNTLKALQAEVGGYIETVTIASDVVVICAARNAVQLPVRRRGFRRSDSRGRP